jgi:hypothetical protein
MAEDQYRQWHEVTVWNLPQVWIVYRDGDRWYFTFCPRCIAAEASSNRRDERPSSTYLAWLEAWATRGGRRRRHQVAEASWRRRGTSAAP